SKAWGSASRFHVGWFPPKRSVGLENHPKWRKVRIP
ncbi:hypothetical protein MAM1_0668c11099, partial [Mucor ambiguus]